MNEHTLEKLEFPKIRHAIRGNCLTPYGGELVDSIQPLNDWDTINRRQSEITQLKDIVQFGTTFPLYRLEDSRDQLHKSKIEGNFLDPKELLSLKHLLSAVSELASYQKDERENFPLIAEYLSNLRAFPDLEKAIVRTVDDDGQIKDNASNKLRSIRNELTDCKQRIQRRLQQIVAKQPKQPGWQDDIVTLRNDRYVIGIPTSNYRSDMGILHDRSQTGATFFIEPKETVELNNRINMLYQEEQMEIVRLLRELTKDVKERADILLANTEIIGTLDLLHACAMFSIEISGNQPIIKSNPHFEFKNVRHPLLIRQFKSKEKVVPNSISLNDDRQVILITGPNTGGKTVLLKTVGLSILMALSGLHISADEFSEVGLYNDIFADIGDEQSLELSLSTFSSHIKNIITGLNKASERTLLLYDEIGAGTDPREGSALAESIIIYGLDRKAKMIVTTHYSQLKTLATEHPELDNGSLDFDKKTLAPTYRLRLGIPGSSYAIDIARRLGMPEKICRDATGLISSGEKSLDNLIESLEDELKTLRNDKNELNERLTKATELEKFYKTQSEKLTKDVEQEKEKALADTKEFLDQTRKEIERLVADIRNSQASEKAVKEFHRRLKSNEEHIRRELTDIKKTKPVDQTSFAVGDPVEIISLKQEGEIEEIIGPEKARIKVGNFFTTAEIRNLRKLDKLNFETTPRSRTTTVRYEENDAISPEVHLRGMTVEEALDKLERFLDQAVIAGLHQVYVIHGKGAGILRRSLTEYLKSRTDVASMRLGDFNEGGLGVTVVKLKD